MPATFPAENTGYVPNHEATGKLVVDYSRNVNSFSLNRYAQIVPVTKSVGYYLKMTVEEAGRILNSDLADFVWADGAPAPVGHDGTEKFEFLDYRTERVLFEATLGWKTHKQASWDMIAQHLRIKSQQAMTARTQKAVTQLLTTGNYDATHRSAVSSISGNTGTWSASTTARQDIKRSIHHAQELIMRDTLAAVDPSDFRLVINPDDAKSLSVSQEIVDYIKGSPEALAQVRGELPGKNVIFGLPDRLYGVELEVERTYKVTTRKGASSTTKAPVLTQGNAILLSRPGQLEGVADSPSFSTLSLFMYEEMTVEQRDDADNRRTQCRVVEDYDVVMTAPATAFLFQSIA